MRILFLVIVLLSTPPLFAARHYAIDLLIFQRTAPDSGEVYAPDYPIELPAPADIAAMTPLSGGPLGGVAAKLERSPGYRVLWHRFWRQAVPAERGGAVIPVHVNQGGDARVDGQFSISVRRYLHLDADLRLYHEGHPVPFKAHQRMRSGETYYIDHPLGGIIVRVLPPSRKTTGETP